jgi:ribosomal protein S24E
MINSTEIVSLTRQIISHHGSLKLYEKPLEELADANELNSLLERSVQTDAEALADTLVDSLELLDEADVIVEEIIEYVGNHSSFKNFGIIAEDEELSEHTPIYLLEKHGAF